MKVNGHKLIELSPLPARWESLPSLASEENKAQSFKKLAFVFTLQEKREDFIPSLPRCTMLRFIHERKPIGIKMALGRSKDLVSGDSCSYTVWCWPQSVLGIPTREKRTQGQEVRGEALSPGLLSTGQVPVLQQATWALWDLFWQEVRF